jgi:general secretion pathway protein D
LAIATLAACNASSVSGGPPVAEWNVAPVPRDVRGGSGGSSGGVLPPRTAGKAIVSNGTGKLVGSGRTRSEATEPVGDDGVTLNLVNLPISQAAKIVIGDIMGADFVVDPKIDGKVTVHTANPVRRKTALDLFQSALRVAGATVVKAGNIYKVVPNDQAAVSGEVITGDSLPPEATPLGETARVVQLRYVSASEMKRVLEPIAERGSIVRADDARNTLTISGSAQDLTTLMDAINMFDIDTMRGMSFAMVPVRSSDPDLLAEDLKNVFGSEREGPMGGMIRFVGNKRLASILVISPQAQYISRARAWIEKLDARAEHSEKQFFTYRVQNRPAKELMTVLASVFGAKGGPESNVSPRFGQSSASSGSGGMFGGGSGGTSSPLGALSASGPTGAGSNGAGTGGGGGLNSGGPSGGGGGFGAGFSGATGSPSSVSGLSVPGAGPNGQPPGPTPAVSMDNDRYKVGVDDAKNALIVMATPEDYRRIRQVIETLDVLPNQIYLEATIAEVRLNDTLRFGVRWFMQAHPNLFGFSNEKAASPALNSILGDNLLGAGVNAAFPGFAYAYRTFNQQVTINALNGITDVNIISTPSLTVLDNREAILQVGDQIPVQTLTSVSAIGNTFNSVSYTNTGVILKLTPHISESGRVMLEIEQEVSNVDPAFDPASTTPRIQQRRVKTQVVVNDSESLMLGGLVKNQTGISAAQIPVAGDVPIVGSLFKDKANTIDKQELIIMITPHVVRSLSEGREITEEYKRKLLDISSRAIGRNHDIEQSTRRTLLDPWSKSPWRADRETR